MTNPFQGTPQTCPLLEMPEVYSQHPIEVGQQHHCRRRQTPTALPSTSEASS